MSHLPSADGDSREEETLVAHVRDHERWDCVLEIRKYANHRMTTMDRARYEGMMAAADLINRRVFPPGHPRHAEETP